MKGRTFAAESDESGYGSQSSLKNTSRDLCSGNSLSHSPGRYSTTTTERRGKQKFESHVLLRVLCGTCSSQSYPIL
jgi:hypothetical protein